MAITMPAGFGSLAIGREEKAVNSMEKLSAAALLVLSALILGGCVVERPPPPRPAAHWVPGHYDGRGFWVPGHWD